MTIEDAISLIPRGRSILFTGSGFSYGAKNIRKKTDGSFCDFRGAKDVSNDIALRCGLPPKEDGYPLAKISNYYLKNKSKDSLISFLKEEFTVSEISQSHKIIGSYPWRRVYTTNYDNVCEEAYKINGIPTYSVTMSTKPTEVHKRKKTCVHINGSITNLSASTLDNEFKLTTGSYRQEDLQYSPWFSTFKEDITNADAVFFIGFSGDSDLDIIRVLQATQERKNKFFFINGPQIDPLVLSDMEDFGIVTNLDLKKFTEKCVEYLKDSKAIPIEYFPIKSFREVTFKGSSKKTKNTDFVNLITLGRVDRELFENSVLKGSNGDYFIYRNRIDSIIEDIKRGETIFLVTSDLGNGKSMFLEGLAMKLEQAGFAPFFFDKEREFVIDEIDYICENRDKPIFIFDDYGDKLSIIRKVVDRVDVKIPIILSERNAHYQTSIHSIDFIDPKLINIDTLNDSEVRRVVRLFSKNALWEDMASLSDEDLERYIIAKCGRQFSTVLLKRFDARQLYESYRNLVEAIRQKEDFYNAILFLLILRYFGIDMEFADMMESIGGNVLNNASFQKNPNIREIIDFRNDEVSFKSSLLAFYLLKNHITPSDFTDFYIKIFNDFDKRIHIDKKFKKILRSLMPYSPLFKILGKNHPIFYIYENISDCNFTKYNPLFWLQFAIARNADGDFPNAEKCFKTAYACAEALQGYDTYQIDTHHAHFLLSRAVKNGKSDRPMELFDRVHKVLKEVRKSDRYRYHVYRVAQDYLPFWNRYNECFTPSERVKYKDCCKEIAKRAEEYLSLPDASAKDIVRHTLADLKEVINS